MKKFSGKSSDFALSLIIGAIGILTVWLTMPSFGFSSTGDMGTSATGMALIRSILDPPPGAPSPFMGYVLNGKIEHYWNWPPNGFRTFSLWLELTGNESLEGARLLSALIYGLSALLLFALLRKNKVSASTALASCFVFLFLPMHLKYGHMVYADIWLPFFWVLALVTLQTQKLTRYWLFLLVILLGTSFMWFAIFLLPFPLLLKALNRIKYSKKAAFLSWLGICLMALLSLYLLVAAFGDQYRIHKLADWSFLELIGNIEGFLPNLFNQLKYLGYESLSLVALTLLSYQSLAQWMKTKAHTEYPDLLPLIFILSAGLLLYVLIMPVWFVSHHYGISMFSVLIAIAVAFVLSIVENRSRKHHGRLALLVVSLTFALYLFLPKDSSQVSPVNQLSQVILEQERKQKPCVFIDFKSRDWPHAFEFGVKELSNGYLFNGDFLKGESLVDRYQSAKDLLELNGITDYDRKQCFVITDQHIPQGNLLAREGDIYLHQVIEP